MAQDLKNFTLNRAVNPNAQFSVGNLVAFADAAGSAPVDGTGGAPTVSIARTISSPLDGVGSFLFTKTAANSQGQGFSGDVVLQPSDATKVMNWSFDYQISTGTYTGYQAPASFSDLTLWIYDITNAVMYQANPYQVDGAVSTTNQYSLTASWQVPVGCLQARLIWFLGNTGASAFTAKFNNIIFGRVPRIQGASITGERSWTPTITGLGSASLAYAYYRITGTRMQGRVKFTAGTATGVAASVSLPSGFSIDTTTTTTATASVGMYVRANTDAKFGNVLMDTSVSATLLYFGGEENATTQGGLTKQNGDTIIGAEAVSLWFDIPIAGLAANAVLGQDADSRVTIAQATGDAASASSGNPIIFPTVSFDTSAAYNNSTGRYTCPVSGYYKIYGALASANTGVALNIYKNAVSNALCGSTDSNGEATFSSAVQANAGDIIDLRPNNTLDASSGSINFERLSGPAQVQAPEIITARYSTNAGQSISNNTVTIIDYEDVSYDDHGCVTTGASWKFTCPRTGKVKVNAEATLASNAGWALGETAYLSVFKSGVEYGRGPYDAPATATLVVDLSVNDTVDVVAGDYIDIRIFQLSGGSISLDTTSVKNYVAINYVGGIS